MVRIRRVFFPVLVLTALISILCIGAGAYTYPSMPSNPEKMTVTVGDVTMPFSEYPDGSIFPGTKSYMTVAEAKNYGITLRSDLWLRGSQCVAFARYTYAALFYKYPQDSTMDNNIAYKYGTSIYYRNMIKEVLGVTTLDAGYSAATLKKLITACLPGSVIRVSGHSMAIMAIFDDGLLIYDSNFANGDGSFEVDVRSYTWSEFVRSLGKRDIEALQMPVYYPGATYYVNGKKYWTNVATTTPDPSPNAGTTTSYKIDSSCAGNYIVYNCTTLNVRSTPSTDNDPLGQLDSGTAVVVKGSYTAGTDDVWYKITYGKTEAWVSAAYLREYGGSITVTFNANGGTVSKKTAVYEGGAAFGSLPTPTKRNRVFLGWYSGDTKYTADSVAPKVDKLTLTALWGVGTYTDVAETAWYASYVEEANKAGIVASDVLFNPNRETTRAEFVTILSRIHENCGGKITVPSANVFNDVPSNAYFHDSVLWGNSVGIVAGMGEGTFGPKLSVQRQQMAVFMYTYAMKVRGMEPYTGASVISKFGDADYVSSYAVTAMNWAVSVGLFSGDNYGNLNPRSPARRCEAITVLLAFQKYLS